MSRKTFGWIAACATGLSLVGQDVVAEDALVCDPGHILVVSERILRDRMALGGFRPPHFGAQSAYLMYHYGGLSDADMLTLLDQLAEGDRRSAVRMADEMALALAVSRDGLDALGRNGGVPEAEFAGSLWHLRHVIWNLDEGESYFALLQAARDNEAVTLEPDSPLMHYYSILPHLQTKSDAEILLTSERAEAAGETVIALLIAANLQDSARMDALLAEADADLQQMFERDRLDNLASTWLLRPVSWREAPTEVQQYLYDIVRASTMSGPADWVGTAMNMTGHEEAFGRMAQSYIQAAQVGTVDPFRDPEAAWLWQYRELARVSGSELPGMSLIGFAWPSDRVRHFSDMASVTMDYFQFFEAVEPVMQGATWPAQTPQLAMQDWQELRGFVEALGEDAMHVPTTEREQIVGFELLWRNGQYDDAVAYAERYMELEPRLTAYRDVARRMDGICDGVLTHPGQSLFLGGQVIYKFPPEPYAP